METCNEVCPQINCLAARVNVVGTSRWQKGMKINGSKKGCMVTVSDVQQSDVATVASESLDDLGHGQPHNALNTHVVLSGEANVPLLERPDGLSIKERFPLVAEKAAWKKEFDSKLSQVLGNEMRKKRWIHSKKLCIFTVCVNLVAMRGRKSPKDQATETDRQAESVE